MLAPGTQIDRYELVCPIGEGGMAQVWVARQRGKHGFAKLFALKAVHHRFADDPSFQKMFLDEARIAAAIEHPNVAQVFDLGESGSNLYLVMEYVDGESLAAILTAGAKKLGRAATVPTPVALKIIADACAGLNAAHKLTDGDGKLRGVVHRDVSPQNILLSVKGDTKVIDFGIAHATDRTGNDTAEGSLKGKLHYMAPEQARHEKLSASTDVFSVGATLYRMLAGRPPYQGGNDAGTLNMILQGAEIPPLPPHIPALVSAIVERAIAHDPGDRYASAAEMQHAIEQAIEDEEYIPNVASWVKDNLSERYAERREQLSARATQLTPMLGSAGAPIAGAPPPPSTAPPPPSIPDLEVPAAPRPPPPAPPRDADSPPPMLAAVDSATHRPPARMPQNQIVSFAAGLTEPSPPEPRPVDGPGFMDIHALAAKKASSAPPPPHSPFLNEPLAAQEDADAPPGPKLELAVERPRPVAAKPKASRTGAWIKLAVAVVVLVLLLCLGLLLVPRIAKDRIISNAREVGVELKIDSVAIGGSGVTLRGVTARSSSLPGVDIHADEIFSPTLTAQTIRISNVDVKLDGGAREVGTMLLGFYAERRARFATAGGEPRHISLVGARVTWTKPLGEGTAINASDMGAELDTKATDEVRTTVGRFEVKTPHTTFGPWSASFEKSPSESRARLLLDPALPDGPNATYTWGDGVSPKLTVRIPREPLANLGIKPGELGLPAEPSSEIEAKIEGGLAPSSRIEAVATINLWGARIKGWKQPVDVKIDGNAQGQPGKALDLDKTTAQIGPFVARITGTITPRDDGFGLDATWRTVPIPCDKLVKAEAKNLGTFAETLHDLVRATGAVKVTGSAQGSGLLKYDTKTPDAAAFTVGARESCGMTLFGM